MGEPHAPQNLAFGTFGTPQDGHVSAKPDPHSRQNFRSTGFSVPHAEQTTCAPREWWIERVPLEE